MLLGNFFDIKEITCSESSINCRIALNIEHPIYAGHFPQQAVVPGVCMMQILTELTSVALKNELALKNASQAKFLIPIIPKENLGLDVKIKYATQDNGAVKITGSIHSKELTFFKFKGVLA
jgi:3-hydroxyacyl-[acyl-carrier-protein] dehydratase